MRQGPLTGLRILEFAGIGPVPFCGMLFSDLGADVVRIDRKGAVAVPYDITARGRRSVALDLKSPLAVEVCMALAQKADGLIEGFRPGVMERLGLGPEAMFQHNPKLAYGRMTGWGQTGPYAQSAGHDINYIAASGALHATGLPEKPVAPVNLLGDFGGGALYLAFGMLSAILHARETGIGQVVDCAMSEGATSLLSLIHGLFSAGHWKDERRSNLLDGGAPNYDTYQCSDGKWVAIGALEPQFYANLLAGLGLDPQNLPDRNEAANWPELRRKFAEVIARKTQSEWCEAMAGYDACFTPVRSLSEAPFDPQNQARGLFVELAGITQPAPLPRFSATPGAIQFPPAAPGTHSRTALLDWGIAETTIQSLESTAAL